MMLRYCFKMLTIVALAMAMVVFTVVPLFASLGKIAGTVTNAETGEPLPAANVIIVGTTMGASTDEEGRYFILNIPPGEYQVKATMMGFTPVTVERVKVYLDLTTTVNFTLKPTVVVTEGIKITATRPLVEPTRTASMTLLSNTEVTSLPVAEVSEIQETTPGFFRGHLRGGRNDQDVTLLDGVAITSPWTSEQDALGINPYMMSELDVLSGTFNAEYGKAMAGMTNIVTPEGGRKFSGNVRWRRNLGAGLNHKTPPPITLDGEEISRENIYWDYDLPDELEEKGNYSYVTNGREEQNHYIENEYGYKENNRTEKPTQWVDLSMGGPLGKKATWFTSSRFYESWGRYPNEYTRISNAFGKVTLRPSSAIKIAVSGMIQDQGWFTNKAQKHFEWSWKYNLENLNNQYFGSYLWSIRWTHILSPETFYEIGLSQFADLYKEYNPKYGFRLPPSSVTRPTTIRDKGGYIVQGDYFSELDPPIYDTRKLKTTTISVHVTSQVSFNHQIKAGAEVQLHDLYKKLGNIGILGNRADQGIKDGEHWRVYPNDYALYVQDRMEYGSLILNIGLRVDAFDPKTNYWDPWRPWVPGDPGPSRIKQTSIKAKLSPRLGVSYLISDRAALHFAYGIFVQRPTFKDLYNQLNRNDVQDPRFGNPNLDYEETSTFEMGVQCEVLKDIYLDLTGYYRDMRNLISYANFGLAPGYSGGGQYLDIIIPLDYAYGDSRGIELTVKKRMSNHWAVRGVYTLSWTKIGDAPTTPFWDVDMNYSLPPLTAENIPIWDRRHNFTGVLQLDLPFDIAVNVLGTAQSGLLYRSAADIQVDPYGRKRKLSTLDWTHQIDLRVEKFFKGEIMRPSIYLDIKNLFNTTNVYALADPEWYREHNDPTGFRGNPVGVYGPPRDIFAGVTVSW